MDIRETKDIRSLNKLNILNTIIKHKHISRADIAVFTDLNKATVSTIVKELLELHLIEEKTIGESTGGRKPIILTQRQDIGYIIAIDINISVINIMVSNMALKPLNHYQLPLSSNDFEITFSRLCDLLQKIISTLPTSQYGLIGISVAVRGVVDLEGIIRFIPNLNWRNINIKNMLEIKFKVPVYVDNDGNLSAIAEYNLNQKYKDLLVITIDDIITGGIISNGQITRGFLGFANSIGHHIIDYTHETQCSCGKYGCWEQFCSTLSLLKYINQFIPVKDIDEFIALVDANDPHALDALNLFVQYMATGITNLIFILNPENIILNSRIISAMPELVHEIHKYIVLPITNFQDISISQLGDQAPLIGASSVCLQGFFKNIVSF